MMDKSLKDFSVVVPTLNERGNILELFSRIKSALNNREENYEIIVVDDDSDDRTWELAEKYSHEYPVRVIRRQNQSGLTTAVLRGVEASQYEIIVVMDADLQHPPEKIPELVQEIQSGVDVAVGSRYGQQGGFGDFDFIRRMGSKIADFLAHTLFRNIRGVEDLMSGFFAFRKEIIKDTNLNPIGFKILLEILVLGKYQEVSEVGYEFGRRTAGKSKLGLKNVTYYLQHLVSLAWRGGAISQFLQFCLVGSAGLLVNLAVLYMLTVSGLHYLLAGALAIEAGLIVVFFLNKSWTYSERRIQGPVQTVKALGKDHLVRLGGMVINLFCLWFFTDVIGLFYMVSQLVGVGGATLWNYTGNQWWTWESPFPNAP